MSAADWTSSTGARVALGALGVSIIVVGWSLASALRAEPLPSLPPVNIASVESIKRGPIVAPTDVEAAVDSDIFAADRSAPDIPYRMPGEARPDDKPVAEPTKPIVVGTVVATDGRSFALMQLGNDRPKLVHVGDTIGEWSVKAIGRGKVTIVTSPTGNRVDVTVPKTGL
jgi:hypothetical protein